MRYSLRRTRDGAGDSGPLSELCTPTIDVDTNKVTSWDRKQNARPEVGGLMIVGSPYARSYSAQDYWQTTIITEILEERKTEEGEYVRFKTGNSEYEWNSF